MSALNLVEDEATLDDLAAIIRQEHAEIGQLLQSVKAKAVRCGQALIAAREQVLEGDWLRWVEDNCAFEASTAAMYTKIAHNAELIPDHVTWEEMRAMTRGLRSPFAKQATPWVSELVQSEADRVRKEVQRFHKRGVQKARIAQLVDITEDTVDQIISPLRVAQKRREKQSRAAEAKRALADKQKADERKQAAIERGGNVEKLYSDLHKLFPIIDAAILEVPNGAAGKSHLRTLRNLIYEATSELAKALGVE